MRYKTGSGDSDFVADIFVFYRVAKWEFALKWGWISLIIF